MIFNPGQHPVAEVSQRSIIAQELERLAIPEYYNEAVTKELDRLGGYTLVISEKPDAARRIAAALEDDQVFSLSLGGIPLHLVKNRKQNFVVCSASGHLYSVSDPGRNRTAYPVFDLEWYPAHIVAKGHESAKKIIELIAYLAERASEFVHACDFDLEGETIGYNILKYACGDAETNALRAKFSTLTREELREAIKKAKPGLGLRLAEAGRTRHEIDFIWGVNLSRALSESYHTANNGYKTMSVGRVQGPTLSYLVDREVDIQTFAPWPYWTVTARFEKNGVRLSAPHEKERLDTLFEAEHIRNACEGKRGKVNHVKRSVQKLFPPYPFSTGDLQREAYRFFKFSPGQTLRLAERLYLGALISYPRTSSQKLPQTIGYRKILDRLREIPAYAGDVADLLEGDLMPTQGERDDSAHPAIYPTGEHPGARLGVRESKVYDLVVRRFLAVFGKNAIRENISAMIGVSGNNFKVTGNRTLKSGWLRYYRTYSSIRDTVPPAMEQGEQLKIVTIDLSENWSRPSPRYNQSSLLELMENVGIGTKATRADVMSTLYDRGYIRGESMVATEVAFAVVETLRVHSPEILSVDMTKDIESRLEDIERGRLLGREVIEQTVDKLLNSLREIKAAEISIGRDVREAVIESLRAQNTLGACPVCRTGQLRIIRSKKTKKRFVGCSRYSGGCRASSPLPQKGAIKPTSTACLVCGWPIIYVRTVRIPWKLCVNIDCPEKKTRMRKAEVQGMPKGKSV